jgi:predicted metal-dependent phosphoesterase TrpH
VLVDFHCHTYESDGTFSPAELTAAMRARGVGIVSVTDHDTLAAYDVLRPDGFKLVTGIEINTTYRGNEVHVLGYGFDLEAPGLREVVDENRRYRETRAAEMVDRLCKAGHELTLAQVRAEASENATLGRPHVAKALVRNGLASSVEAAFRTMLSPGRPGYVPSHYIRPQHAVATIARAGGVPVLAHPGRLKDEALIGELVEAGIAGLEAFYPAHQPAQIAHFRTLATQHGLVMTAGSDFHDPRWNVRGVGMEVEEADIRPFLDLVL